MGERANINAQRIEIKDKEKRRQQNVRRNRERVGRALGHQETFLFNFHVKTKIKNCC